MILYSLRRRTLVAAMVVGCCGVAAARSVRAIFIQGSAQAPTKAVLYMESAAPEIELPGRNLSPEVDIPGGNQTLAILAKKVAKPEDVPAGAQKILIPETWSRCILLFFPDPKNAVFPARVIPLDASAGSFPLGNTLIYNVSNAAVMARLNKEVAKIVPGKSEIVKPPLTAFGSYPVAIDGLLPGETKPRALCRSTWQHDPDARQILFITPAAGYDVPRVWGILDRDKEPQKKQ